MRHFLVLFALPSLFVDRVLKEEKRLLRIGIRAGGHNSSFAPHYWILSLIVTVLPCGQFIGCPQTFVELQLRFKLHFPSVKCSLKRNWSSTNVCGRPMNWPLIWGKVCSLRYQICPKIYRPEETPCLEGRRVGSCPKIGAERTDGALRVEKGEERCAECNCAIGRWLARYREHGVLLSFPNSQW